jgi:hypothetical protein
MASDYSKNFEVAMTGLNGMDSIQEDTVANDPGDPKKLVYEDYYKSSAKLGYYKGLLNDKLKAKNPEGFAQHFAGLVPLRRSGDEKAAAEFMEKSQWNDYLSADEVQKTLGDDDYKDYLDSMQTVNKFNLAQGRAPLYGTIEGEQDINNLNYGRRFASLTVNTMWDQGGARKYSRLYKYDPKTKKINVEESGDLSQKPKEFQNQ